MPTNDWKNDDTWLQGHIEDWVTATVDAAKKSVHCDCEQCNRYGLCILSAAMRVLPFNQNVPNHCKQVDEGFGWSETVSRARRVMKDQNIVYC